ncbi:hypothetical protein HID58_027533 [Brassica napus]|uniref:Uncharacterized protein n=1 Tax=Brassica napus TaxID=3708 RepID=A0ABQ8CS29_BRANA|nr:hypothetical protein HID58_027533 [Brassica napus]
MAVLDWIWGFCKGLTRIFIRIMSLLHCARKGSVQGTGKRMENESSRQRKIGSLRFTMNGNTEDLKAIMGFRAEMECWRQSSFEQGILRTLSFPILLWIRYQTCKELCGYAGFMRKLRVYRRAWESRSSYIVEFMFKPYTAEFH